MTDTVWWSTGPNQWQLKASVQGGGSLNSPQCNNTPPTPPPPVPPGNCNNGGGNNQGNTNYPVNLVTGEKSEQVNCLSLSAKDNNLDFGLSYRARDAETTLFDAVGPGWRSQYAKRLRLGRYPSQIDYVSSANPYYEFTGVDTDADGINDRWYPKGLAAVEATSYLVGTAPVNLPPHLEQTSGAGFGTAGAESNEVLAAGADGWAEITVSSFSSAVFGLNDATQSVNHHYNTMDYAVSFSNYDVRLFASGTYLGKFVRYTLGDKFRVERVGTDILFKKNGNTFYIINNAPQDSLRFDSAYAAIGSGFKDINASFASVLTMRDMTAMTPVPPPPFVAPWVMNWSSGQTESFDDEGRLLKACTATGVCRQLNHNDMVDEAVMTNDAYWAGADSIETLAANTDGWVEFTAQSGAASVGLTDVSEASDISYQAIDYAAMMSGTYLKAYSNGVNQGDFGGVAAGDVLRVERVGSTMYFKRNGNTYHTIENASTAQMRVDIGFHGHNSKIVDVNTSFAGANLTWLYKVDISHPSYPVIDSIELWSNGATSAAQTMDLVHNSKGKLLSVKDATAAIPANERRQIDFGYDANGYLNAITKPDGGTTSYEYGTGNLAGYITKKVLPNMQPGSGTEAEGWYIQIDYETTAHETIFRVAKETWFNAQNQAQKHQEFVWGTSNLTLKTFGADGTTLVRSQVFEHDGSDAKRLSKVYVPGSTTQFAETIFCDTTLYPTQCPSENSRNKVYQTIAPNGDTTTYAYDTKGRVLSITRQ